MKLEEQKQRNCFVLVLWKLLLKKSHENLNYNLVLDNGYRKSSFKYGIIHHSRILGHNMTNTPLG
jgi:hypothetical protein